MIERLKFKGKVQADDLPEALKGKFKTGDWVTTDALMKIDATLPGSQGDGFASTLSWFFILLDMGHIDPSTVGQWTGAKDQDGTDIYEGDLVDAWDNGRHATFEVRYRADKGSAPMWILFPAYQEGQFWSIVAPQDHAAKVIGNIHEASHDI